MLRRKQKKKYTKLRRTMKWIKYLKCTQSTHTHKKKIKIEVHWSKIIVIFGVHTQNISHDFPYIFNSITFEIPLPVRSISILSRQNNKKKKTWKFLFAIFLLSVWMHFWCFALAKFPLLATFNRTKKKHEMERFRGRRPADLKALHHIFIRSHSNYLCSVSCSHYPFSLLLTHERYFIYGEMRLGFFENQNKRLRLKTCLIIKKPI